MWKEYVHSTPVRSVSAKIEYDSLYSTSFHNDMELKRTLANKIANELLKHNFIEFQKNQNFEKYQDELIARVIVGEPGISNVMISDYYYEVDDKKFTHQQIEEAVKNSFPEYWF